MSLDQNLKNFISALPLKPKESKERIDQILKMIDSELPLDYYKVTDFDGLEEGRKQNYQGFEKIQIDFDKFWALIEKAASKVDFNSDNYRDKYCKLLKSYLKSKIEIENFDNAFTSLYQGNQIEDVLNQTEYTKYFSDDRLMDFSAFIISRGKKFYEFCLSSAQNMKIKLDLISNNQKNIDNLEFEELLYITQD